MKNKTKALKIFQWIIFAYFLFMLLFMKFNVFFILMLLTAIAVMPIKPVNNLWVKISKNKKWIKPLVIVIALIIAIGGGNFRFETSEKSQKNEQQKDSTHDTVSVESKSEEITEKAPISSTPSTNESTTSKPNTNIDKQNSQQSDDKPSETQKPTETTKPIKADNNTVASQPTHTHSFSKATCTSPAKCSCGATSGSALGHKWQPATYSSPEKCSDCGATKGAALAKPGEENYHGHVYTGGTSSTKFHYEANCAGKNSHEITWNDVDKRNLGPCGTCVLK